MHRPRALGPKRDRFPRVTTNRRRHEENVRMFTPRRRSRRTRPARTPAPSAFRSWTAPLALAAAVALMAAPAAAAQSEARVEVGGTIAVSSLGSTADAPG